MQGNSNDDSLTIILNNASNVRPCDRATSGLTNSHEFAVPKPKPRPPAAKQPQQPEWIERSLSYTPFTPLHICHVQAFLFVCI